MNMFKKLKDIFSRKDGEAVVEEENKLEEEVAEEQEEAKVEETEEERSVRPLLPHELETFKKGMGITPHNYWTWASRTNNFKLLTDGEYVWVEGHEDHIGKQLPLTQQKAWSWKFIRERLQDFGGEG
ncbi:hypothetical protein HG1285_16046 [Hydrogenivirga sp. 128-5-R1-1]|nr:hypothetical protein HG1285_16046 [Hydrogenivirga sp. 128-5-R1-1]